MDYEDMIHGENHICHICGMVYEKYPMISSCLDEFYQKDEEKGISPYREIYSYTMNSIYLHFAHTVQYCKEVLKKENFGDWLDIGSGDPWITKEMQKYGSGWSWDPGFDHTRNFKSDPRSRFDLVTCMNMLEHVYAPIEFLQNMHPLVSNFGNLILCVPYVYTNSITMHKDQWFSNAHIHHFDINSLDNTCLLAGWKIDSVQLLYEEMGQKIYVRCKKIRPKQPVFNFNKEKVSRAKDFISLQNQVWLAGNDMKVV